MTVSEELLKFTLKEFKDQLSLDAGKVISLDANDEFQGCDLGYGFVCYYGKKLTLDDQGKFNIKLLKAVLY